MGLQVGAALTRTRITVTRTRVTTQELRHDLHDDVILLHGKRLDGQMPDVHIQVDFQVGHEFSKNNLWLYKYRYLLQDRKNFN